MILKQELIQQVSCWLATLCKLKGSPSPSKPPLLNHRGTHLWLICQSVVLPVLIDSKNWRSARNADVGLATGFHAYALYVKLEKEPIIAVVHAQSACMIAQT